FHSAFSCALLRVASCARAARRPRPADAGRSDRMARANARASPQRRDSRAALASQRFRTNRSPLRLTKRSRLLALLDRRDSLDDAKPYCALIGACRSGSCAHEQLEQACRTRLVERALLLQAAESSAKV